MKKNISFFTKEDFKSLILHIFMALVVFIVLSVMDVSLLFEKFFNLKHELLTQTYIHVLCYTTILCDYIYLYIIRKNKLWL